MTTLHILLPAIAHAAADPAVQRWLARGDRLPGVGNARVQTLRECFHFAGDTLPVAALRHHCYADDAAAGTWLCADPVWVQSEATGARLMAWPLSDVSAAAATELAAAVRPLLADTGALCVDAPDHWCLRLAGAVPAVPFALPATALGANLLDCLPAGDAGRPWRRLFTEVQVALHACAANAARSEAGQHPVNALWFWGAGSLPADVATSLHAVATADDSVRGLAKLGGATYLEPSPAAFEAAPRGDALLDLDQPGVACDLAAWLPHCQRWLRVRRFDALQLTFAGGERYRVRHAHRLRFWRHA
ncbi:MAG TPA: phosphoglycerate mutase [Rhodanobacteraceae bacterium]